MISNGSWALQVACDDAYLFALQYIMSEKSLGSPTSKKYHNLNGKSVHKKIKQFFLTFLPIFALQTFSYIHPYQ